MTEVKNDVDEPPGQRRPPFPWQEVPLEQWNDWRWQLRHRLNTAEELARLIHLSQEELTALSAPGHFRAEITPTSPA